MQRLWGVFAVAGGAVVATVFVVGVAVVVGDAGVVSSLLSSVAIVVVTVIVVSSCWRVVDWWWVSWSVLVLSRMSMAVIRDHASMSPLVKASSARTPPSEDSPM